MIGCSATGKKSDRQIELLQVQAEILSVFEVRFPAVPLRTAKKRKKERKGGKFHDMTDSSSSGPLTASCIRTLTDKLYEKRKAAALEIEKLVRDYVASNQLSQVEKILNYTSDYTHQLILPVLDCFTDSDSRVRYFACEALYNILKVAREGALVHFSTLFDTLCRLATDTDQNVRNGSDLLDRLLKDVVTSSKSFEVSEFMCLLRERIHTKNSNVRRFLVSWLNDLYSVPEIFLLPFLPEVLDGLFQILSDPAQANREMCRAVLGQFLKSLKYNPKEADLKLMVNVLIVHAQSKDELVQYTALEWLKEFLPLGGPELLNFASGYLLAILPCLAYRGEDHRRSIYDEAKEVNIALMRRIKEDDKEIHKNLELQSVVDVLQEHLNHEAVQTRVESLKWIHHLHENMPTEVFPHMENLFPVLLKMLSDTSDEVVLLDLEVLSDVCQDKGVSPRLDLNSLKLSPGSKASLKELSAYFVKFVISLLEMFRKEPNLLQDRGSFIIRQLCLLLKPEEIFRSLAVLLTDEGDTFFVSQMVQTLNGILLTSTELFQLRNNLKSMELKSARDLFVCLYKCWSNQPVALVGLCLLAQCYGHAAQLINYFTELEITVDFLTEIDKFIQLLESPIFAYLRLHLLDPTYQQNLASVLYGLLMLLPQTEAFHTLHRRLQCLPVGSFVQAAGSSPDNRKQGKRAVTTEHRLADEIPFDKLVEHFQEVQCRHRQYQRLKHRELLSKTA